MDDLENLSNSVEGDVNNFFNKASKVDESPVIEGFDDFFEVTDISGLGGGGGDGGPAVPSDAINQDTSPAGSDEYAISINGVTPTDGDDGVPVVSSSFTIRAVDGTFTITSDRIANGGTLGPETLSLNPAEQENFPVGDGFLSFAVFAVVTFKKNSDNYIDDIVSGQGNGTKIVACPGGSFPFTFEEGFSRLDTDNPQFMFKIGIVHAQKKGLDRRVLVDQLQIGPKVVVENDTPFYADFDHANNKLTIGQGDENGKEVKVDQIVLKDSTGVRLNIDIADLPATAKDDDAVKLREVKVCNSGVPATAFILMSKPVDTP